MITETVLTSEELSKAVAMYLLTKGLTLTGDVGIDNLKVQVEVNLSKKVPDYLKRLAMNEYNREYYHKNKEYVKSNRARKAG